MIKLALLLLAVPAKAQIRAVMEGISTTNNVVLVDTVNVKVGINTSSATNTLDVRGSASFGNATTQSTFTILGNLYMTPNASIASNGTLTLSTAPAPATKAIYIDTNGVVAIGTNVVQAGLTEASIYNGFNLVLDKPTGAAMQFNTNESPGFLIQGNTNPDLQFLNKANAVVMALTNGAKVGIGTTNPAAQLTVGPAFVGTAPSTLFTTNAGALGTTSGNTLSLGSIGFTSSINAVMLGIRAYRTAAGTDWTTTGITVGIDVDNTVNAGPYIEFDHSGNIGIGTTAPTTLLYVNGAATVTGNLSTGLTEVSNSCATSANAIISCAAGLNAISCSCFGNGASTSFTAWGNTSNTTACSGPVSYTGTITANCACSNSVATGTTVAYAVCARIVN